MTSAETTPSPRPVPAHAAEGGEYGESDRGFDEPDRSFDEPDRSFDGPGRGSTADTTGSPTELIDGAGPAPASAAGPTAAEDGPVLLPVDPPDDRLPDEDVHVATSDHTDGLPAPTPGFGHDAGTLTGDQPDSAPTPVPAPSGSGLASSTSSSGVDWHELQSRFVDDPAAAVSEAGEAVEQAVRDLRGRLDSDDTESLRTAFRRYRELYNGLN